MNNGTPPRFTGNVQAWAASLYEYLLGTAEASRRASPAPVQLAHKVPSRPVSAATDGIMMYDPVLGKPVISIGGVWKEFDIVP